MAIEIFGSIAALFVGWGAGIGIAAWAFIRFWSGPEAIRAALGAQFLVLGGMAMLAGLDWKPALALGMTPARHAVTPAMEADL